MHRRAQLDGNKVINIAVFDDANLPDWAANWPVLPDGVGFGWVYENGNFTESAE